MTPVPTRDHRIDLLRGVSILLVLLHHFHLAYPLGPGLLYRNGNYGVTIFFVISGYLITSTTFRRFGSLGSVWPRQFYALRFARLYPCLLLVLAVITLPGLAGVPYFKSKPPVSFFVADLSVLTFWHNVLMAHVGYFNYGLNILWSLSVEEVFYLLFPILCCTLRKPWMLAAVWVAVIVYAPFYRSQHMKDDIEFLYGNFSCFDAIAMGCCAAVLARHGRISRGTRRLVQSAAAAGMVSVFFYAGIWSNVIWGPTLMATGVASYLWAEGAGRDSLTRVSLMPLEWAGRHSYELYLFHIVVLGSMRNILDRGALPAAYKWSWFALFLVLSALSAGAIARWYGDPLNSLLRRELVTRRPSS